MLFISRYINAREETTCKLIGHRVSEFTDSGYQICTRCGAHGYYDFAKWGFYWHFWPYRLYWRLQELKYHAHPGRLKIWLAHWRGQSDDIPF